jgi:hypothetical protein
VLAFGALPHFGLRLSTILLSWGGLAGFYDLLRQERVPASRAGMLTGALALNPIFFLLQGTFLSDVPALSFSLIALAWYGRAFRNESRGYLVAAMVAALLAVTTRQNAVAVVVTAAMLFGQRSELRLRSAWWLGVLIPLGVGIAVHIWFRNRSDVRTKFGLIPPEVGFLLPYLVLHYSGVSVLPVITALGRSGNLRAVLTMVVLMVAAGAYWFIYGGGGPNREHTLPYGGLFPYRHNLITPWGAFAGPQNEPLYLGERPQVLSGEVRLLLSFLGCLGGGVLAARIWQMVRPTEFRAGPIVLFTLWQLPFLLFMTPLHDRYLLTLLPGALFFAGAQTFESRGRWVGGLAALGVMGLLSLALMHDWLSWNGARWELGRRAVATRHIDPLEIEGGFEWDGWSSARALGSSRQSPSGFDWFPEVTGRYALSFSIVDNTEMVESLPYRLWLRAGDWHFYLLKARSLQQ